MASWLPGRLEQCWSAASLHIHRSVALEEAAAAEEPEPVRYEQSSSGSLTAPHMNNGAEPESSEADLLSDSCRPSAPHVAHRQASCSAELTHPLLLSVLVAAQLPVTSDQSGELFCSHVSVYWTQTRCLGLLVEQKETRRRNNTQHVDDLVSISSAVLDC